MEEESVESDYEHGGRKREKKRGKEEKASIRKQHLLDTEFYKRTFTLYYRKEALKIHENK